MSFKNRVIYVSAAIAFILILGIQLLDQMMLLPSLLAVLFLSINLVPQYILKSKGIKSDFVSNFSRHFLFNLSLILPVISFEIWTKKPDQDYLLLVLLLFSIAYIIALFWAFIHTSFKKVEKPELDTPIYQYKDILLQPRPAVMGQAQPTSQIPSGTAAQKPVWVKLILWFLVALMIIIPFGLTLQEYGYFYSF